MKVSSRSSYNFTVAPSRRQVLALISVCPLVIRPAFADGNVGIVDLSMTQNQFCRLSQRELEALRDNDEYWENFTVAGFSSFFGRSALLEMATTQRRRTCRMIRDLSRINGTAARRRRIQEEIDWATDLRDNLIASIRRLEAKADTVANRLAIRAEKARLRKIDDYRKGLKSWHSNSREGSRNLQ